MQAIWESSQWYSSPKAYWTIKYESQRSGNDMLYRFYWNVWIGSASHWYDAFTLRLFLDGAQHDVSVKGTDSSKGWSYEGTTGWYTVANKTSGTVSFFAQMYNASAGLVKATSGSHNLGVLPAAATLLTAPDFTDLENPTITFSNPGNFGIDVWLEPNPVGDHICARGDIPNTGSYTWELSDEEREALRNSCWGKSSCTIRFLLYTHIGNTTYVSYVDKTFTITESNVTEPSVSMDFSANNGSLPSTFDGMYIQGKTRLDVKLSAERKYGATISSYYADIDGKRYNSDSFITDVITRSGTLNFYGCATDSRGFTGYADGSCNVVPYSKPLLVPLGNDTAIQCYRSDGNGVRVGNSTSVWIKTKMTFYSVEGKNSCVLEWRKKPVSDAWNDSVHKWTPLTTTDSEYNGLLDGVVFDRKTSYTVQIRAIDTIKEQDLKTFEIPTEDVALHLGKGGKNVAIGTYCNGLPERMFYSDWVGLFDKGLFGASLNFNVTDVLEFPKECTDGITPIIINSSTNKDNLPVGDYAYSVGIIHKRAADQYNVILMDYVTGKIAINVHLSGTWTGWKYITPQ